MFVCSSSLCCQCGTAIEPNAANTCVACLRTRVDITEGIPKQANIYFCKGCERWGLGVAWVWLVGVRGGAWV